MDKKIHSIEIKEYNGWLLISIIHLSPKIKFVGIGTMLSDFNINDLLISKEALSILSKNIGNSHVEPALEIIRKDCIWWASKKGILIPPNELLNVYNIPHHTICDNIIDIEIKKHIDNVQI